MYITESCRCPGCGCRWCSTWVEGDERRVCCKCGTRFDRAESCPNGVPLPRPSPVEEPPTAVGPLPVIELLPFGFGTRRKVG